MSLGTPGHAQDGQGIRYFHGWPGSDREMDRLGLTSGTRAPGKVHLSGFSLGSFAALRYAAQHPDGISRLTLISPVAPLQAGDWLGGMAGRSVFRMAQDRPRLFTALTRIQGGLAKRFPGRVLDTMFANADASERVIARDPHMRALLIAGLLESLGPARADYMSLVSAYVGDWRDVVRAVQAPVTLVSGQRDSWAPQGMAYWLADALDGEVEHIAFDDTGHYGTLLRAADILGRTQS